ncbi:G patch domain-containing protein 11 [Trichoderma lentiforme]|uniref:G patch domain-containing protein 11 n=1 Tax=Trichoderma lentiforme TaxID=1567552 RepID=A0A9P4XKY2_9HYPO|nr:G patch domain-containing protein 11 [Trichoderma lentiforme]
MSGEDDEDDYMNMTFQDPTPATESSVQRAQRLKKESRARGVIKSKAQLAQEEVAAREKALSTSMLEDPRSKKSKGLAMMAKMGFKGGGLGKKAKDGESSGKSEPIKISMKEDRGGIGMDSEKKRKLQEAIEEREIKTVKIDPLEYRERMRVEREDARLESQLHAAQRTAERLDDEKAGSDPNEHSSSEEEASTPKPKPLSSRPLKSIPVLYRGLIRHREEKERDRRMRYDLEQSLSRLPTYENDEEDEDDKKALGKKQVIYSTADDLDEEDEELDEFNALEPGTRLSRLVMYLRETHHYCFWCKMAYLDAEMDGCPGITEEDHD